jgi:hypothetical protein
MYPDHGKYALDQIAKAMRSVPSREQSAAGLSVIDAAKQPQAWAGEDVDG